MIRALIKADTENNSGHCYKKVHVAPDAKALTVENAQRVIQVAVEVTFHLVLSAKFVYTPKIQRT